MSPSNFLKTTTGDAHLLPQGRTYPRRSRSINFCSFATTNDNKCTSNLMFLIIRRDNISFLI